MADWEFLIQKEGDLSWLPLDSPNVEILEGRYRIVARSGRINTPVELRVTHFAAQETPPQRRLQKRISQTNETGLVAVIPFTQLQAGTWELQCVSTDLMSDLLGNGWQYEVRLQVQPRQAEEDWEAEWSTEATDAGEDVLSSKGDNGQTLLSEQALPSAALLDSISDAVESTITPVPSTINSTTSPEQPVPPFTVPEWPGNSSRNLTLRLEQPAIVANHGQAVMVAGWVEVQVPDSEQTDAEGWAASEMQAIAAKTATPESIQLWLRDPQTLEVISHDRQPFPDLLPPFLFTFSFTLPDRLITHLILGEVQLCGQPLNSQGDLIPIDTQVFSITVNPAEWMHQPAIEEVPAPASMEQSRDEVVEAVGTGDSIQLPALDLPAPPPDDLPLDLELSFLLSPEELDKRAGKLDRILPPQIYHPGSEEAEPRSLQLPQFPQLVVESIKPPPDQAGSDAEPCELVTQAADSAVTVDLPAQNQLEVVSADQLVQAAEDEPETEVIEDPYVVAVNQSFKALNLHDRFLSRLSSLATDRELAVWLKAGNEPHQIEQALETPPPIMPQPDYLADEIVVEDQPVVAPRRTVWRPLTQSAAVQEPGLTFVPDQPIDCYVPVPELNLASGELVSGELVQLRVRLPAEDGGYYAKVWVIDCETRQLLDGPYWLVDFIANGFGGQDAFMQLTVPFGSTAIQFEAIALEIHSQWESRKAIAMRPVVPPDLPAVTFDEFSDRF